VASRSRPARAHAVDQPFPYPLRREFVEPDWTRIPGYRDVDAATWRDAQWQRVNTVKNLAQLKQTLGGLLTDAVFRDALRDQAERATMSLLIPPQMLNTIDWNDPEHDPIRRYMLPVFTDRDAEWPSHPLAARDSLHEADMWAVEGLTHRYPTKVLAELLETCPQYCGHCTRMDLVGNSTEVVNKYRFQAKRAARWEAMLEYLRATPSVRDVVVSGGDVANLPIKRLEEFVTGLLDIDNIRDIRLATKGLMGIPQHFLQDDVIAGIERLARKAHDRGVSLAVHTHVNAAPSVTPLVAEAVHRLFDAGVRDVRNQGVLLRGVNTSPDQLLDLCFTLLDHAQVTPYYFYTCDVIPNSEHWRISVARAQQLQHAIMGYLPGFATPRIVCDVPFVGKRWVHMLDHYDRLRGISYWTKNYRTGIEDHDHQALKRLYPMFDPIDTLSEEGRAWWRELVERRRRGEPTRWMLERVAPPGPVHLPLDDDDPGAVAAS